MRTLNKLVELGSQLEKVAKEQQEQIQELQKTCNKAFALLNQNWDNKDARSYLGYDIGNMDSFMEQFEEGVDMQISGDYPKQYEVCFTVIEDEYLDTYYYNVTGNYGEFISLNSQTK